MATLQPRDVLTCFLDTDAMLPELQPFGAGRIHDTWAVYPSADSPAPSMTAPGPPPPAHHRRADPSHLLQRINRTVFPDYRRLMENVDLVSRHLDSPVRFERTRDGLPYHRDDHGEVWRLMRFVPNSAPVPVPATAEQAGEAARAYGEFATGLADLDPARVPPIIAGFHDTPARLARLRAVRSAARRQVADLSPDEAGVVASRRGRLSGAEEAFAWIAKRAAAASFVTDALASGRVPLRVCHNDAKADNVLLDRQTGRRLCVVDLDTVMPGSLLYDVGDLLRSAAATVGEDDPETDAVDVRWECARAIVDGFAEGAGRVLADGERELMTASGWLLAAEQAVRYLTDYLEGDRYYRAEYPQQNLDRARNQIALARALERAGWWPGAS
jgi:N-acetylhexosamine 1-kinase